MKTSKALAKVLVALLLLGVAMVPQGFAQGNINMYVDPDESIYYTGSTPVGTTFTVDVVLENITAGDDLVGIEFKLYWDPTILEGMNMVIPSGSIWEEADADFNLWIVKMTVDKVAGYAHYIVTVSSLSQGYTAGYLPLDESPSGIAARITLKIIDKPARYEELTCALDLVDTKLSDGSAGSITHTVDDGLYRYIWSPPSYRPYLTAEPSSKTFNAQPFPPYTPEFAIDIVMNDLDAEWHLVGLEFKLSYNTTLLNVTSVTEGPFMGGYGDTWFAKHVEFDYVYVFVLFYPLNETNPTTFPEGGGVVATITFQGIYAEEFPWVGSCDLDLYDIKFADDDAREIPQDPESDSHYTIKGYVLGRQLDVFVCDYPEGYNGAGPEEPSDAFAPQDLVCLCAYLTYNLDPIQNKLVSFEIHSPYDDHIVYLTGITNETGYAKVCWRIPWPCPEWPEDEIFGIWDVYATADVANEVVSDTMQFRVGWLVELISVESTEENWYKGNHTEWKITFKTISAQDRNVTFTLVLQDELGVPIGRLVIEDYTVGGADLLGEKFYNETMICLEIPKWAYIGTATAHVNAYTTYPSLGGHAYCPEVTTEVRIVRP